MTTDFGTDPNTQTVAAAWASSPLGQPEREVRYGFAAPDSDDFPASESFDAKRAVIAAALASGVIAGAALGVTLFDFSEAAAPTVVVPRSEGRLPAAPPAVLTETRTVDAPSPSSVVSEQKTGQAPIAPAPPSGQGAADVGTPPAPAAGDTTVVVDIPIPDYPPLPENPAEDSEEPDPDPPQPPDVPDLDFKLPEPPLPEPDPVPPTFAPDLPLAPAPPTR